MCLGSPIEAEEISILHSNDPNSDDFDDLLVPAFGLAVADSGIPVLFGEKDRH
jgi:hypothetical protein